MQQRSPARPTPGIGQRHGGRLALLAQTLPKPYVFAQGDAHILASANATAARTARVAEALSAAAPDSAVLVLGLLPRGDVTLVPDAAAFQLPSKCGPLGPWSSPESSRASHGVKGG